MDLTKLVFVAIYIIVDITYILTFNTFFYKYIKQIQGKPISPKEGALIAAILAYVVMGLGWLFFIVPRITTKTTVLELLPYTIIYGGLTNGIFNATNYITFENWKLELAIVDTTWGILWVSILSIMYLWYIKNIKE